MENYGMQRLFPAAVLIILTASIGCSGPTPAASPQPTQAPAAPDQPVEEYSMNQLREWYDSLGRAASQVPGVAGASLDEETRRIEIRMYPRRGSREGMEAAVAALDIPRDAIVIDIGCAGSDQQLNYLMEIAQETFLDGVTFSVEVASQAPYGETVSLKLVLRNVSNETVRFYRGGRPSHDFVVSAPNGDEVWHWWCAKYRELPLGREVLGPGEALELYGEWEQVDNRGKPVPAGDYLVRGVLFMETPEQLVTSPHKLEAFIIALAKVFSETSLPLQQQVTASSLLADLERQLESSIQNLPMLTLEEEKAARWLRSFLYHTVQSYQSLWGQEDPE